MSEPLTVADTQLDEASKQIGSMDAAMLSSTMVDKQLSADLPSDLVLYLILFQYQLQHIDLHMFAANHKL